MPATRASGSLSRLKSKRPRTFLPKGRKCRQAFGGLLLSGSISITDMVNPLYGGDDGPSLTGLGSTLGVSYHHEGVRVHHPAGETAADHQQGFVGQREGLALDRPAGLEAQPTPEAVALLQ